MRTTLRELRLEIRRRLLEFGVDDDNRYSAGFFMAGGVSGGDRDREASLMDPPPGLGGPSEDDEEEDNEEQQKGQAGARVYDRSGGEAGSSRVGRQGRGGPTRDSLPGEDNRW